MPAERNEGVVPNTCTVLTPVKVLNRQLYGSYMVDDNPFTEIPEDELPTERNTVLKVTPSSTTPDTDVTGAYEYKQPGAHAAKLTHTGLGG